MASGGRNCVSFRLRRVMHCATALHCTANGRLFFYGRKTVDVTTVLTRKWGVEVHPFTLHVSAKKQTPTAEYNGTQTLKHAKTPRLSSKKGHHSVVTCLLFKPDTPPNPEAASEGAPSDRDLASRSKVPACPRQGRPDYIKTGAVCPPRTDGLLP